MNLAKFTDRSERNGNVHHATRMSFFYNVSAYFAILMNLGFFFSTCFEGRWACESLSTPSTCAVEEGSHVTTFDGKDFTFHGDCYYTLAKVERKVNEP